VDRAINVYHLEIIFKRKAENPANSRLYSLDMRPDAPDDAKQRSFPYHWHP
jgi:hypothetical protein